MNADDSRARTGAAPRPGSLGGAGSIAVAVLAYVALSGVYLGSNWIPVSRIARFLISEAVFLVPIVGATLAGWLVYRRAQGVEKRFWLLLTAANAVLSVSECYYIWWVVFKDAAGPPPVYAPFQVMHVLAAGLFFAMLLSMTRLQNATVTLRWRWALDMVSAATIVFVFLLEVVVGRILEGVPGVTAIERLAAAAYPTWGAAMLAGAVTALLGFKVSRWRPWERLIALSLCVYAAGISAWPILLAMYHRGAATLDRGLIDIMLLGGHYVLLVATVSRLRRADQQWPLRPMPLYQPARDRRVALVVPGLSAASVPVLTFLALRAQPGGLDFWVYLVATTVLAVAMVARSTVVAVENGRLFHRAVTDALTGLFNLRFLHERLDLEVDLARRFGEPLSVALLDIDDFERVNDLYGHPAGDELLRSFGDVVRSASNPTDIVCRPGGDEFAVIMPDSGVLDALRLSLRVQQQLTRLRPRDGLRLTASVGLATFPDHAADADDLIRFAEGARDWVKRHGKDHALVYDPALVAELDADDRGRSLERQSHVGAIRALAAAVDARNPADKGHSRNVAAHAVLVARELGIEERRVRLLESAALMHDVGMIGVADEVLGSEGPLDEEGRRQVIEHPALGQRILASTPLTEVLPWVRHHHERWDGTGYPDRLRAVEIPLEARVLAVCDAYDAMTSGRPYREALPVEEAVAGLVGGSGSQFDPSVVEVFLRTLGIEGLSGPESP